MEMIKYERSNYETMETKSYRERKEKHERRETIEKEKREQILLKHGKGGESVGIQNLKRNRRKKKKMRK